MPLQDMTIDTNVLLHAENPAEQRFQLALRFLECLVNAESHLCIDEGFDLIEGLNRSLIGAEYLSKLVHGTFSYNVVVHLAQTGRLAIMSRTVAPAQSKRINQLIANKRDRTFVRVSINSREHVLVSHDYADFSEAKLHDIQRALGVSVVDAAGAHERLV